MRIEYSKPWFLQTDGNEVERNVLTDGPYAVSITFRVLPEYKRDNKIGFFGIPGKNYGISYDYVANQFVFEFWTKEYDDLGNAMDKFNCQLYDFITPEDFENYINITIQYDGYVYYLYKDFRLFDTIHNNQPLIPDYNVEPILIGCHNTYIVNDIHKCITEMDINHFSIFTDIINIKTLESLVKGELDLRVIKEFQSVYAFFDLTNEQEEFLIIDEYKKKAILKRKYQLTSSVFDDVKQKLNTVGCGFCLAKWTQVTMHLHNGMTHSCHHPSPHKVSIEEVERNPTALHNSKIKKLARKEMMEGKKPKECQYCWNIEENTDSFSDRVFKSAEPWSEPHFEDIRKLHWRDDYNPKYVEVSFANTCNFKCAYCGPLYSSKWVEEINQHGAYKLPSTEYNGIDYLKKSNMFPYKQTEQNPYVDAFWNWWPRLYDDLDTFRITGGEPMLSKDFWSVLDSILANEKPNRNLKFNINTNLGVDDFLIDRLIEKLGKIIEEDRIKECVIFTSCDTYGKQSEYIRYGMNYDQLMINIEKILGKLPKVSIVVMSTFNIFSIFSYELLIRKIYELKLKYYNNERYWNSAIILDTSYLTYPSFLSFKLLTNYINEDYFNRFEKFMKFNSTYRSLNFYNPKSKKDVGFSLKEIEKVKRLREYFLKDDDIVNNTFYTNRKDFLKFTEQYEKRRGLKCEDYFPELVDLIETIKKQN